MKTKILLLASAAMIAAASCTQESPLETGSQHPDGQEGKLIVNLSCGAPATRAEAVSEYNEETDYEMAINKVEVLVFDKVSGDLHGYLNAGTETSIEMNVLSGEKTIYAIVNSPEDLSRITEENDLNDVVIRLEHNSINESNGFVMAGKSHVTVTSGTTTAPTIMVDRFTSRIALVKVINDLPAAYGELVIEDIFLANVVANQNLGADADATLWYNIMGRTANATTSDDIIGVGDNMGTCPDLTHKVAELTIPNAVRVSEEVEDADGETEENAPVNFKEPNYLFYAFPNAPRPVPTDEMPWDTDSFEGGDTRLILTATVDGKLFYYPIVLERLDRNTSYDVSVRISGFGVTDPDDDISKGVLKFDIQASEWGMGAPIYKDL